MRSTLCALVAACLLVLTACGGGASGADAPTSAALRVYVTDAPFPGDLVACATVVIREVRVREASGGGRNAEESVLGEDHVLDAHAHLEVAIVVAHTVVEHHLENEKGTGYGFAV